MTGHARLEMAGDFFGSIDAETAGANATRTSSSENSLGTWIAAADAYLGADHHAGCGMSAGPVIEVRDRDVYGTSQILFGVGFPCVRERRWFC